MTEGASRVIAGRYRLIERLGHGGMGVVWHARDEVLGREVAVKEIRLPVTGSAPDDLVDLMVRRALREARAAARLRHPAIVTVHDVVTDDGRPWIVMELIRGRSLAEVIAADGVLPARRAAEIGLKVLGALDAAHRRGILHRDVKPANIMLDGDRVVLTDFGIAAIDGATALTATGLLVGSPDYLAPERINGRSPTAAVDMWGLGVTLYAAVAGSPPFHR
jgi:serine/threonine protein kinase